MSSTLLWKNDIITHMLKTFVIADKALSTAPKNFEHNKMERAIKLIIISVVCYLNPE
jgi:hypothetical protein